MDASQLYTVASLVSAVADFFLLAGVAWHFRETINRSAALRATYPIMLIVFLIFAVAHWRIVADGIDPSAILQPTTLIVLNLLAAVVWLATLNAAKFEAQAAKAAEAAQKAIESEAQRLAAEKRWLDERQTFLVVIGHELRTPINLITGYLDMLASVLPTVSAELGANVEAISHLRQFAEGAISGAARLRIMLRMFNATNDSPRLIPLNLCDVVYRAVNDPDLYTATRRSPADVPITINCAPLLVQGDYEMLVTAVFELIRNGLKATRSGYVKVDVTTAGETAVVAVEDNGRGIAPGDMRRIWEAGYQNQEDYHVRQNEGAGYGLAVVLHIARMHGGDAALEWTELEEGSRFAIYLPAG